MWSICEVFSHKHHTILQTRPNF